MVDALAKRLPVAPRRRRSPGRGAADRFLAERAVRVGRDRRLGVDRFSTPELLALERQLVDGATQRADERCAVVRPEVVRQVLDRQATAGEDQAAMVRDLTRGGAGVAVVGRPGRARPGRWGWRGRPSSWTATRSSAPRRPGSPPSAWPMKASPRPARSTGCCWTSAVAG